MGKIFRRCAAMMLCCSALTAGAAEPAADPGGLTLERVVLFLRHGVRPPTKSAAAMAPLSDAAWPDEQAWGAAPGELTPHGELAIRHLGSEVRNYYVQQGLLPAQGSIADLSLIWADGADQRTRETAKMLALGMSLPDSKPANVLWSKEVIDPLFDALGSDVCRLDPQRSQEAVAAQSALETPQTTLALARMQTILAPQACAHGAGSCLASPNQINTTEHDVKISGPLATAATVAEVFLLEYENGLPMTQVGFGRASAADIAQLLTLHEHTANLTRRTPYVAARRAYALTRFILAALAQDQVGSTTPAIDARQRLIVLTGHDTNLSNLAGVFGLDWQLPDQPDSTAPGTTLAFERWRDRNTGAAILQMRLFYQTMEQVRTLSDTPVRTLTIRNPACANGGLCELKRTETVINAILPKDCTF